MVVAVVVAVVCVLAEEEGLGPSPLTVAVLSARHVTEPVAVSTASTRIVSAPSAMRMWFPARLWMGEEALNYRCTRYGPRHPWNLST